VYIHVHVYVQELADAKRNFPQVDTLGLTEAIVDVAHQLKRLDITQDNDLKFLTTKKMPTQPVRRIEKGDRVRLTEDASKTGTVDQDDGSSNPYRVRWDNGGLSDWMYPKELEFSLPKTVKGARVSVRETLNRLNLTQKSKDALQDFCRRLVVKDFPSLSPNSFSQDFLEVAQALNVHGIETEGDLKYIGDSCLDQLFTTQLLPLTSEDKTKIRTVRSRLLRAEEERVKRENEERTRLEQEFQVRRNEVQTKKRETEETVRKNVDAAAVKAKTAEEELACQRKELALETKKREAEEAARKYREAEAVRAKSAAEVAACKREEETLRQQGEARQKRERETSNKLEEVARQKFQKDENQLQETFGICEAIRRVDQADANKKRMERETREKGEQKYTACFGKCNHKSCRRAKKDHFGSEHQCFDPQVLAAGLERATEEFSQASAAADAARKSPTFLKAVTKAKSEMESTLAKEKDMAAKKSAEERAKHQAAAAAAKKKTELKAIAAQQAAASAEQEAANKANKDKAVALAVKKEAEAKAKADTAKKAAESARKEVANKVNTDPAVVCAVEKEAEAKTTMDKHAASVAERKKAEATARDAFSKRSASNREEAKIQAREAEALEKKRQEEAEAQAREAEALERSIQEENVMIAWFLNAGVTQQDLDGVMKRFTQPRYGVNTLKILFALDDKDIEEILKDMSLGQRALIKKAIESEKF